LLTKTKTLVKAPAEEGQTRAPGRRRGPDGGALDPLSR
jgi:hypothetical protein